MYFSHRGEEEEGFGYLYNPEEEERLHRSHRKKRGEIPMPRPHMKKEIEVKFFTSSEDPEEEGKKIRLRLSVIDHGNWKKRKTTSSFFRGGRFPRSRVREDTVL